METERTPPGKAPAIRIAAAAMGYKAFVTRERATATTTLNAQTLWCVALTTAPGETAMTVAHSREREDVARGPQF